MVDNKRYDPTITRFRKHTQNFVSEKTKKGHLNNNSERNGDLIKEEGILVKVDKNNINKKGWLVKVDGKEIWCTYGDNIIYLPPCTLVGSYYLPKKECKVEVSIDKKSKINTITRIKGDDKKPIAMTDNEITLETKGDTSITLDKNGTSISGAVLTVENDITIATSKNNDLPDEISVTDLYKRIEYLESKISDSNDI